MKTNKLGVIVAVFIVLVVSIFVFSACDFLNGKENDKTENVDITPPTIDCSITEQEYNSIINGFATLSHPYDGMNVDFSISVQGTESFGALHKYKLKGSRAATSICLTNNGVADEEGFVDTQVVDYNHSLVYNYENGQWVASDYQGNNYSDGIHEYYFHLYFGLIVGSYSALHYNATNSTYCGTYNTVDKYDSSITYAVDIEASFKHKLLEKIYIKPDCLQDDTDDLTVEFEISYDDSITIEVPVYDTSGDPLVPSGETAEELKEFVSEFGVDDDLFDLYLQIKASRKSADYKKVTSSQEFYNNADFTWEGQYYEAGKVVDLVWSTIKIYENQKSVDNKCIPFSTIMPSSHSAENVYFIGSEGVGLVLDLKKFIDNDIKTSHLVEYTYYTYKNYLIIEEINGNELCYTYIDSKGYTGYIYLNVDENYEILVPVKPCYTQYESNLKEEDLAEQYEGINHLATLFDPAQEVTYSQAVDALSGLDIEKQRELVYSMKSATVLICELMIKGNGYTCHFSDIQTLDIQTPGDSSETWGRILSFKGLRDNEAACLYVLYDFEEFVEMMTTSTDVVHFYENRQFVFFVVENDEGATTYYIMKENGCVSNVCLCNGVGFFATLVLDIQTAEREISEEKWTEALYVPNLLQPETKEINYSIKMMIEGESCVFNFDIDAESQLIEAKLPFDAAYYYDIKNNYSYFNDKVGGPIQIKAWMEDEYHIATTYVSYFAELFDILIGYYDNFEFDADTLSYVYTIPSIDVFEETCTNVTVRVIVEDDRIAQITFTNFSIDSLSFEKYGEIELSTPDFVNKDNLVELSFNYYVDEELKAAQDYKYNVYAGSDAQLTFDYHFYDNTDLGRDLFEFKGYYLNGDMLSIYDEKNIVVPNNNARYTASLKSKSKNKELTYDVLLNPFYIPETVYSIFSNAASESPTANFTPLTKAEFVSSFSLSRDTQKAKFDSVEYIAYYDFLFNDNQYLIQDEHILVDEFVVGFEYSATTAYVGDTVGIIFDLEGFINEMDSNNDFEYYSYQNYLIFVSTNSEGTFYNFIDPFGYYGYVFIGEFYDISYIETGNVGQEDYYASSRHNLWEVLARIMVDNIDYFNFESDYQRITYANAVDALSGLDAESQEIFAQSITGANITAGVSSTQNKETVYNLALKSDVSASINSSSDDWGTYLNYDISDIELHSKFGVIYDFEKFMQWNRDYNSCIEFDYYSYNNYILVYAYSEDNSYYYFIDPETGVLSQMIGVMEDYPNAFELNYTFVNEVVTQK